MEPPLALLAAAALLLLLAVALLARSPWPRAPRRAPLRTMVVLGSGALPAALLRRAAGRACPPAPAHARPSPGRPAAARATGGHTAEMFALLGGMDLSHYAPRCYVVAATDRRGARTRAAACRARATAVRARVASVA